MLGEGLGGWFIAAMVLGALLVCVLALVLERVLVPAANGAAVEV
jgi:hypothetical protein